MAEGEIAQSIADDVTRLQELVRSEQGVVARTTPLTTRYVLTQLQDAVSSILASGGEISEVAHELELAHDAGLITGLAIGMSACPERRLGVG